MQQVISPYVTAGVALVGSSIVVVTPVASPLPDLPDIQSPAVQLTADEADASFPWLTELGTDLKTLSSNFLLAPDVDVQQFIVNAVKDPSDIGTELQTVAAAITLQQGSLSDDAFSGKGGVVDAVTAHTLTGGLGHSL
ncbi:MAG TPA: hypothetical protein VFQ37_08660, partial [Mycobacterium sp.]|nr:hypothetical protein [Mycobacterium sp.]